MDPCSAGGGHTELRQERPHLLHRFVSDGEVGRLHGEPIGRLHHHSVPLECLLSLNPARPGLAEERQRRPVDSCEKTHAGELGRQAPPLALRLRAEVLRAAGNRRLSLGFIGINAVRTQRSRKRLESGWLRFRASSTHAAYPPGLIWQRTHAAAPTGPQPRILQISGPPSPYLFRRPPVWSGP